MSLDTTHVLLVEDSPGDARLVDEMVREMPGVRLHHVDRMAAALAHLAAERVDVVLLDLGLPDSQGLATLRAVIGCAPRVPVVVLTGLDDEVAGQEAIRTGAQDYLVKGQVGSRLLARTCRHASERKRAEERERLARVVLEGLNRSESAESAIHDILGMIKTLTGLEAVGIRLREGDDFPYFETNGFPDEFVRAERSLCERDQAGQIVRDAQGKAVLECMCGNVLSGRTDAKRSFFTEAGSFWSNGTTELLATTSERDRQSGTRNRCNGEGYESVALIPLRSGDEIIGLLQLNDRRRDRFDAEMIQFFEGLGASIGIALARRRAEETLRQGEEKYRGLFENAGDAIFIADAETEVILDANGMAEKLLGMPKDEIIGMNRAELHPRTEQYTLELGRHVGAGKVADAESVVVDRAGRQIPVRISATLLSFGDRKVMQGVFRDITEFKRAEKEHEKLEEQLRQSQKVEAIGRLAGGVAHDFNNLTAIVVGYGEMLLSELRPESPLRTWAEQIVQAGRRSAALTRQLLAFSRRQALRPEVIEVNALLKNLEQMLGRLIGEDVALELRLAPDVGRVLADPGQIEQVVTNLAVNARDAMPLGGRLVVETANLDVDETLAGGAGSLLPGRYVRLTLTDTGCGMDKTTMGRLFEPFFTTKEKGKGTGLGLATAYGVVNQSGGYINAYSEPGLGTTFRIYLPRTEAKPEAKAAVVQSESPKGHGEQILLVEDEAPLRGLCEVLLTRLGYRVVAAGSGPEALSLVEEKGLEPQLVLTDVVMPGMSGAEVAERLRRNRPGLPVLFMSGYPDETIAPHGVVDVGTPLIQKPFTERALADKVREVLERGAAAARQGRRVLMIDDDEQFRQLIRRFCTKRGHAFAGVDSSAAALEALAAQTFDVLLVDLNIPGTDGARVLQEIRAAGHAAPAIVLTGDVASADLDVLRPLGAIGALEKSSDAGPLLAAIESAGAPGEAVAGTPGGTAQTGATR